MYKFGNKSYRKLLGVNPLLALITIRAIKRSKYDFSVFEGIRSRTRQRHLVTTGRSWTMRSKHIVGNAVDLVPYIDGRLVWDGKNALEVFKEIKSCMKAEGHILGVTIRCGADWKSVDRPHFELLLRDSRGYNYLNFKGAK